MTGKVIIYWYLLLTGLTTAEPPTCLTGIMTGTRSWVDQYGAFTSTIDNKKAIDLSTNPNPTFSLQEKIATFRSPYSEIKYLSMAKCNLPRVPKVFQLRDNQGRTLAETIEFITFFGNHFTDFSTPGEQYDIKINATNAKEIFPVTENRMRGRSAWSAGFQPVSFPKLRELDLRNCSIQVIGERVFNRMPNLEVLYLGENRIYYVYANAFAGLNNLRHLDLSKNLLHENKNTMTMTIESPYIFSRLRNLKSLDLSFTRLTQQNADIFYGLGKRLEKLSICSTGITNLQSGIFRQTSIRFLDVSNNRGILSNDDALQGLEDTLQVLFANYIGLRNLCVVENMRKLEVLQAAQNEITELTENITASFKSLQILDLTGNRMSAWTTPAFSLMRRLSYLSLRENNINLIFRDMLIDIRNINYVSLGGNFIVCNCYSRDFLMLGIRNEYERRPILLRPHRLYFNNPQEVYLREVFKSYNELIRHRTNASIICDREQDTSSNTCDFNDTELETNGRFLLADYSDAGYQCMSLRESKSFPYYEKAACEEVSRDSKFEDVIAETWNRLLMLMVIPLILLPILSFVYVFRRNLKYFVITMRNSAMLSLISKNDVTQDDALFNYDVFVSYCNEDRVWVLDHLLPHLETECSISVCLHERDFQVGLSILENIVSCMDRSRSIMLIISQRFLLSQWCQFEMHLAQHRLLETRREDLTLILLEEIPRRLRPNTLHYLMLTKTYIVWPKEQSEQALFWRRMKKTLVTQKLKHTENISLA